MVRLVQGWGINDEGSSSVRLSDGSMVKCPLYRSWCRMLERCFSQSWKERYKTYEDSLCCEDWRYFSAFKLWAQDQPWQGNDLDKDLLVFGNKEYSPETCIFIPPMINKALRIVRTGKNLPGVSFQSKSWSMVNGLKKPWMAKCYSLRDGNAGTYLGNYSTEKEAHNAWRSAKAEALREWAELWKHEPSMVGSFSEKAYNALIQRASLFDDYSIDLV